MTDLPAVAILGVFVADAAFRAERPPRPGETLLGNAFALGPGGKGSNQAVAAARLGARVTFISKLGDDAFADLAMQTWADAGVTPAVQRDAGTYTGAACIYIEEASGENAIIICPGAAGTISPADVEAQAAQIRAASVFVTQLEQPVPAARRGLEIAREAGVTTVFNPAPASSLDDGLLALCNYVTPNETEAADLTGMPVETAEQARAAAEALIGRGAGAAVITLGERGALIHNGSGCERVPAFKAGAVVDTTGAGDAFNGAFAVALARGQTPVAAVRYGCAAAALSVTRAGTALSMPHEDEVDALLGA